MTQPHVPEYSPDQMPEIQRAFGQKRPFVIRQTSLNDGITFDLLRDQCGDIEVVTMNSDSYSETISLNKFIDKIHVGERYRIRADHIVGEVMRSYFPFEFFESVRSHKKPIVDRLLDAGKKNLTAWIYGAGVNMCKHAHVTSSMILQCEGTKRWHFSNESLWETKFKRLFSYVFLTEKNPDRESSVLLTPGDVLYMPAYWFHYTTSPEKNFSLNYFFSESLFYYAFSSIRALAIFDLLFKWRGLLKVVLSSSVEYSIGDRSHYEERASPQELEYLEENDFA